jgi:putative transposase
VDEGADDRQLLRLIDEPSTATPLYGIRRRTAWLRGQGDTVKRTRVQRLMRPMGLVALDAKPRLSQPAEGQVISPYLRRGVTVTRANQVWSADITDGRLQAGVVYVVAVLDWCSRDVLSWTVSVTVDVPFCLEALEQALRQGPPESFNPDQGAQFTRQAFTARLQNGGGRIRMEGRGRAVDNVFVERLWRTVQSEEVYLRDDHSVQDAREGLGRYLTFDNEERRHQALGYRTPAAVCQGMRGRCLATSEGKEVHRSPQTERMLPQ